MFPSNHVYKLYDFRLTRRNVGKYNSFQTLLTSPVRITSYNAMLKILIEIAATFCKHALLVAEGCEVSYYYYYYFFFYY